MYLFIGRAPRVTAFNELCQADRRRQGTASHVQFLLSNHVLLIGYVDLRRHNFVI
jgi:hypothetical protein